MHHKERKKRIATGRMAHLSLKNSELWVGRDFSERFRSLPQQCSSFLLYPSPKSLSIDRVPAPVDSKVRLLFVIDATWHQAYGMMMENDFLQTIPHVSLPHLAKSEFAVKLQPRDNCLSTIEAIAQCLTHLPDEGIGSSTIHGFLRPFRTMVCEQLNFEKQHLGEELFSVRKGGRYMLSSEKMAMGMSR